VVPEKSSRLFFIGAAAAAYIGPSRGLWFVAVPLLRRAKKPYLTEVGGPQGASCVLAVFGVTLARSRGSFLGSGFGVADLSGFAVMGGA
jgi:hypothetical protein